MTAVPGDLTDRVTLLRAADTGIATAERSLLSARRTIPVLMWSLGLMVLTIVQFSDDIADNADFAFLAAVGVGWWALTRLLPGRRMIRHGVAALVAVVAAAALFPLIEDLDDDPARMLFLTVWIVLGAGVAWSTWVYVRAGLRLVDEIGSWRSARRDPGRRSPDHSEVPLEIATVHDLRDHADFAEVVATVVQRSQARLFDLRVVVPTFVLMITGLAGLVFALAPLVGLDDSAHPAASAASGLVLLAPWAWAVGVDMMRLVLGRQTEANQVQAEVTLYAVRRHRTTGAPASTPSRFAPLATPFGRFLLIAWAAVLVLRLRTSSGLAIVLVICIVAVGTVLFAARYVQLSRQIRIYPLAGRGPSVEQAPGRQITLRLVDDTLQLSDRSGRAEPVTIPVDQIVAVEPVKGLTAMARTGVGIVTTDAPIILTGRSLTDDPVVVQLRERLDRPR